MATIAPPAQDVDPGMAQRWYVLIVMMLVYTVSIADRYVLSTLLGPISKEFGLSDSQTGYLGIPLALFYVGMGIPLSWLCDRRNRRNLLAICVAIWSAMTALTGATRSYVELLLVRIGVGIGEAGGTPACNSIVADYFPCNRRSMAMTVFALGAPIGAWLGSDIAGYVSNATGSWRAAFLVLGLPGLALALLIWATIKEPPRGRFDTVAEGDHPTIGETLAFLWSQKAAIHGIIGSGLSAFWGWGLMWFTPLYLQRMYGMNEAQAGSLLGEIYLVGGIGASLVTAWLVARPSFTDPRRIAWLLALVTAVATLPSFLAYWTHDLGTAKLMWWLFIPAIYFYIGPAFALCQNLSTPKMRAMTVAISLLLANVLNLIVAPWIVGHLSDYFAGAHAGDAESLRMAQMILAPSGLWAAWHYWRASKYIVEDQKRAVGHV